MSGSDTGSSRDHAHAATGALKPSEVLAKAADLLTPEGAWTQGAACRAADGVEHFGRAADAVCWCAIGAIDHVRNWGEDLHKLRALTESLLGLPKPPEPGAAYALANWNDAPERTQAEVVAALRKASSLAADQGQ